MPHLTPQPHSSWDIPGAPRCVTARSAVTPFCSCSLPSPRSPAPPAALLALAYCPCFPPLPAGPAAPKAARGNTRAPSLQGDGPEGGSSSTHRLGSRPASPSPSTAPFRQGPTMAMVSRPPLPPVQTHQEHPQHGHLPCPSTQGCHVPLDRHRPQLHRICPQAATSSVGAARTPGAMATTQNESPNSALPWLRLGFLTSFLLRKNPPLPRSAAVLACDTISPDATATFPDIFSLRC